DEGHASPGQCGKELLGKPTRLKLSRRPMQRPARGEQMEKDGSSVGKRIGGALYVHRSAVDSLPPEQARLIADAAGHVPQDTWNVAKIDLANGHAVSLLDYEDFAERAFPALLESRRVDLRTGAVTVRRYRTNPPILHRKELLLPLDAPGRDAYVALTRELERRGL